MNLAFTKMHGLGNDFVVIDAISQKVDLSPDQIRSIAHRHYGVGCDQLLLVENSSDPRAEFRYRIFNADGGEVQQCGNGARCFAVFVRDQGLTANTRISVETAGGLIELLVDDDLVTVDMGVPNFSPESLPFDTNKPAETYDLVVNTQAYAIGVVSMGNPHAVVQVDDVDDFDVATVGAGIEAHPSFPERVNAGFMQIVSRDEIRLRVFERGVGETLACGTGACAAVAVGRRLGKLDAEVTVHLRGGDLIIDWADDVDGERQSLTMKGPAATVFEGHIQLK